MPTFRAVITRTQTITTTSEMEIEAANGAAAIARLEDIVRRDALPRRGVAAVKKDVVLANVTVLLKDSLGRKVQPSAKALEEARKRMPRPAPKKSPRPATS